MADTQQIKREDIIIAGITMFSERGYHQVTMDQLAEFLGCSKPMIYRHFKSKDAIMHAAARYIYKRLRARKPTLLEIELRLEKESPADILRSVCLINSAENYLNRSFYQLLYKEAFVFVRLPTVSYYIWLNYYRALHSTLGMLSELGVIPSQPDDTLAEMWTRVMFMYSLWQTFDPYCKELGDVIEIFINIAVRGVDRLECSAVSFARNHTPYSQPKTVRDEILSAACEVFSSYGYDNTTIRRIAAKLNIPPSKIYNYFDSKQDLMDHILDYLRQRDIDHDIFHRYRLTKKLDDLIAALSGNYTLHDKYQIERYRIWIDMIYRNKSCRYHCLGRVVEKRIHIKNTIRELVAQRPISNSDTYSLATIYIFNHAAVNIENAMFYREGSLTEQYRVNSAIIQASIMRNGLRPPKKVCSIR